MSQALLQLRNIGPKTAEWLLRVDINGPESLRNLGAIAAYERLLDAGYPENLNCLWALEGAIQDRDFLDIARHERERLLTELAAQREWHQIE
ncbi:MAG: TfoX/Sxy family DNA transformation protein [Nevskiales bacterium]